MKTTTTKPPSTADSASYAFKPFTAAKTAQHDNKENAPTSGLKWNFMESNHSVLDQPRDISGAHPIVQRHLAEQNRQEASTALHQVQLSADDNSEPDEEEKKEDEPEEAAVEMESPTEDSEPDQMETQDEIEDEREPSQAEENTSNPPEVVKAQAMGGTTSDDRQFKELENFLLSRTHQ